MVFFREARKNQKDADFVQINIHDHFIGLCGETLNRVSKEGLLQPQTVGLMLEDGAKLDVCISLPWVDAFPENGRHSYGHYDVMTEVNDEVIANNPIFRGSIYGYEGRVTSARKYATQAFKDLYDSEGWTGLIFDQVFPLKAAID